MYIASQVRLEVDTGSCAAKSIDVSVIGGAIPWAVSGSLLEIYLVMGVSTTICEHGFSCMKRVKSDWRSTLGAVQLSEVD